MATLNSFSVPKNINWIQPFAPATPVNITNWNISFYLYDKPNGTLLLTKSVGAGIVLTTPSTGVFTVTLTTTDLNLATNAYWHVVRRTDSGAEDDLSNGTFTLYPG